MSEGEAGMKAKRVGVLAIAVALVAVGTEAEAQGFRVRPWIGMYAPTSELGSVQAVEFGKKESTLAYGAALEFGQADRFLNFRFDAAYATSSDVPIADVGCAACELRSTVLTATGAVVIRPFPLPAIRPYAVVGAGAKWYDFEFGNGTVDFIEDQTKFTAMGGLGVTLFPGGPLSLFAELTDYMSGFDFDSNDFDGADSQHDLFFKAGLSIGIGPR